MLVFAWGAVSWMVLPWHAQTLHPFLLEGAVQQSFDANAPASGIYLLPRASHEKMPGGPFAFVVLKREGVGPMQELMLRALGANVLAAVLVAFLLSLMGKAPYGKRLAATVVFALAAGAACYLPNWVWWGFPTDFTLLGLSDLVVGWFVAGLVMAKLTASSSKKA